MREEILTICREIYEHKYTFGTGYRKISKLLDKIPKILVKHYRPDANILDRGELEEKIKKLLK